MTASNTILKAAAKLFSRNGYAATGVALLAETAGVTKRTLYKHFGSKDGLFLAWLQRADTRTRLSAFGTAEEMSNTPDGQILAIFTHLASLADLTDFHGCPFSRTILEFSGLPHQEFTNFSQEHKAKIADWFCQRVIAAECTDIEVVTEQICILYEGTLMRMVISKSGKPALASRKLVQLLLDM